MRQIKKDHKMIDIRETTQVDVPAIKQLLDAVELFPSEMLDEMIADYSSGNVSTEIWLSLYSGDTLAGFCYATPEELTEGTWNLLAIAIDPKQQGNGLGASLIHYLENMLREACQRLLIIETSGVIGFAQTRKFYLQNKYREEARIEDFWAEGDDKIIFTKRL